MLGAELIGWFVTTSQTDTQRVDSAPEPPLETDYFCGTTISRIACRKALFNARHQDLISWLLDHSAPGLGLMPSKRTDN
jgi:hypothetical protein